MARQSSNRQPAPVIEQEETGTPGHPIPQAGDATAPEGTKAATIAALFAGKVTPTGAKKAQFLGTVRQQLAELADLSGETSETEQEREELAENVAHELYQARIDGLLSADELSSLLGEYLGKTGTKATKSGFVEKKDGTPGKTPAGYGGVLRKRIVRFAAMHDYLNGVNDGGAFFSALPDDARDDIQSVADRMESGQLGLWEAYRELGEIRKESITRPKFSVDARRISALADELGSSVDATVKIWLEDGNQPLLEAYAKLGRIIAVVRDAAIAAASK